MHYTFADLSINVASRRVSRADQPVDLHGLSFDLLVYLLSQGDRVVAVNELIESVWKPALVNEETVTQRIKLIRQALGDDSRNPRYLRTVRGRGYQLCAPVKRLEAAPTAADEPKNSRAAIERWLAIALIGGILLLGALWWPRAEQLTQDQDRQPPVSTDSGSELLDRARHYASIGQRDDTLRAIDLYRLVLTDDPDSVRATLGLSFASSAMMCRHNDGAERAQLAHQLAEQVLGNEPENAAAYSARAYAADCQGLIDLAIADYRRAIEIDPENRVSSLASLAHLLAVRGQLVDALRANLEARRRGQDLPLNELQLAHNLELLGYAAAAEHLLQRSYRLYPDNSFIAAAWPAYLYRQGRTEQARSALQESMRRPQHPSLWVLAGELALQAGDIAGARKAFAAAVDLKADAGPAKSLLRIYSGELDRQWADERLQELSAGMAGANRWPNNWLEVAQLKLALEDPNGALDALRLALQGGYRDRLQLAQSPLWRALRENPAFTELLDQIATEMAIERERARDVPGFAELLAESVR